MLNFFYRVKNYCFSKVEKMARFLLKRKPSWEHIKQYNHAEAHPDRYRNIMIALKKDFFPVLKNKENAEVLDLGCANGWFDFEICPYVKRMDAYDLSPHLIKTAKRQSKKKGIQNISFFTQDIASISIKKKYDSVLCMGLFTCIVDEAVFLSTLKKVHSCLRIGGIYFCKDSLNKNITSKRDQGGYFHIYRKESEYVKAIEMVGFELLSKRQLSDTIFEQGMFSGSYVFRKI